MDDYQQKLIHIFAKHNVRDVSANPALLEKTFGRKLDELAQATGFSSEQERIQELKAKIEKREDEFYTTDSKGQINIALEMLFMIAMFEKVETVKKMDIMRELFLKIFDSWTARQVEHFMFVSNLLKNWNSYFISYSNYKPMDINLKYKKVISYNIPKEILKQLTVRSFLHDKLI